MPIDRRRIDAHAWMVLLHELDPLGRGDDTDHADIAGAGLRQMVERGNSAYARSQHVINHEHHAVRDAFGQLRIVLRRDRRTFSTLKTDTPDARGRYELEDGVQHTEAGT